MGKRQTKKHSLPSGTVTFLFTDIEGSTQLLQRLGDVYSQVLAEHRTIMRHAFEKFDGWEVDTQGDSFFIAFERASNAMQAAVEAQRCLIAHSWPGNESLRVRMALHTGEPKIGPTGYIGIDVHRAARLCSAGHGGQILLTEATRTIIDKVLPEGISLQNLGEHHLKDLQRPETIYQLMVDGLPFEFPPLKSLALFPNNLPIQLTSFIGRESEIDKVKRSLIDRRLVTLIGVGGSGKTRLAIQAATESLDAFPNGIWFIDLAPLSDPAFLVPAIARVLGLREEIGRPIREAVFDYLQTRTVLLILDNCEHLAADCANLSKSLLQACPRLHILATSREALGIDGEGLFPVPPLSLPKGQLISIEQSELLSSIQNCESVQLFIERAMLVYPVFGFTEANALSIAQICQHLDGIPLAIELAAARTRVMGVDQILARLDDRFRLLTGGYRTALPRQQTLQALVDWSYDLLSEAEKKLFGRLAIFAGGWTLEAAEEVCSDERVSRGEILDLLTRLVDKSMVQAEPVNNEVRFRMLETIRQYSRERLLTSGEAERVSLNHFEFYSHFVEICEKGALGADTTQWLRRLDCEKDNCYAALDFALQESLDKGNRVLQMAGGLWVWWHSRGILSEGRQWLEKALESGSQRVSSRAKALVSSGALAWQQGDIKQSTIFLEEGISILRELETPDLPGLASATHIFGHVALDQSEFAFSKSAFQESLDLYRKLDDQYYVGTLISDLGVLAYHQGEYSSARAYQEESLEIFQEHGNPDVISQTLHRIGELARLEGDYEQAEVFYEKALRSYREIDMKLEIASNLHKLGYVAQHNGDFENAKARFRESLSIQREVGNKQGIAECLAGLAGLAAVTGQPERALRLFAAAKALLDAAGVPLAPADLVEWERDYSNSRAQLDNDLYTQLWSEGYKLDLEQAIDYALC